MILPDLEVAKAKRKSVKDIGTWMMCFTIYMATAGKKHPDMTPSLLAYRLQILWAHQEYEEPTWREYDVRFRQQAVDSGNRAWVQLDPQLHVYDHSFVGRARWAVNQQVSDTAEVGNWPARAEQSARDGGKAKTDVCFRFNKD